MKKILCIMILGIFCGQLSFSDAYIKLMSDESGSELYVDSEIVGTYDDIPLEFILPAGEYLVEVKKDYVDESYGYYKKIIKVGKIDIKVSISAVLEKKYPEEYYLRKATTIDGGERYLRIYPNSKHSQRVKTFIEMEYVRDATTIEKASEYLEKYPNGRYAKKMKIFVEDKYAEETTTLEGAEWFLEKYPNSKYKEEKKILIELEYAKRANTIDKVEDYLKRYPKGRYSKKLQGFVEEEYYRKAIGIEGAKKYLKRYPEGKYSEKIISFIEEGYYKKASNLEGIKKYLEKYPYGKYSEKFLDKTFYLIASKIITGTSIDIDKTIYKYDNRGNFIEKSLEREGSYVDEAKDKIIYTYDEGNKLIIEEKTERYGKTEKTTYKYDINNNMIEKHMNDSYDWREKTTYKYDNKNNMIEKFEINSNGEWGKNRYEYNYKNKLIEKISIIGRADNVYITMYIYNSEGQLKEEKMPNRLGSVIESIIYTYDSSGNLIKKYRDDFNWEIYTYGYNTNNQLVRSSKEFKGGFYSKSTYKYDSYGNIIEEYEKGKSRYRRKEIREYKAIKLRDGYRKKEL